MKTIAVSVEEEMVARLDRYASDLGGTRPSRSAVVRIALSEYFQRREQDLRESREREVIREHKDLLNRQAEALVAEQAMS